MKKQNEHSFIAASFDAQSLKRNETACNRSKIMALTSFLSLKHGLVLKVTKRKLLN